MSENDFGPPTVNASRDQGTTGPSPNGAEQGRTESQQFADAQLARRATLVDHAKRYIAKGIPTLSNFESRGNPGWEGGDRESLTAEEAHRTITAASILFVRGGHTTTRATDLSFIVVDIDVDDPRAAKVDTLLGWPTTCDQRDTKQRSHLWFLVYNVPDGFTKDATGGNLEVRGAKHNTLAVPSRYLKDGKDERLRFVEGRGLDALMTVMWPDFKRRTDYARAVLFLTNVWVPPESGQRKISRHDLAVALSGWLTKERWEPERITTLITDVVDMAGDEIRPDFTQAVTDAAAKHERRETLLGYSALADTFGKADTDQLATWLGIDTRKVHIQILNIRDVLTLPDMTWVVNRLLVAETVALISAPRGSWKSFLSLDLAFHVALGKPWCQLPVEQGSVLYLAGEGFFGQKNRVAAWLQQHTITGDVPVDMIGHKLDLSNPTLVQSLRDAITEREQPYKLIVVDTLARNKGRMQENSNDDMQYVLDQLEFLAHDLKANVTVLHHVAKATGAERGATSFADGAQSVYKLERKGSLIRLTCEKQRDGPEIQPLVLAGEPVIVPSGESSLVLAMTDPAEWEATGNTAARQQEADELRIALETLAASPHDLSSNEWRLASGLSERSFTRARDRLLLGWHVLDRKVGRWKRYRVRTANDAGPHDDDLESE